MSTNNNCYSSTAEHKHKLKKNKQLHVGINWEGPRTGLHREVDTENWATYGGGYDNQF